MKRKDLRDIEERPNVFINEDLTKTRSKLLFDARSLVRVNKLKTAYSANRKIFIRNNEDKRLLVKSDSNILEHEDPDEARKELERERRARYRRPLAQPRFVHTPYD